MKKILIATTNPGKLQEIKSCLLPLMEKGIKILTLFDLKIKTKPEEIGATFKENAKIKARFYGDLTQLPTIADDGGLIIPYLNNEPGVRSRRWLGYEASDEELIQYTLKRLNHLPPSKRKAYLETCVCFYHPQKNIFFFQQEKIDGFIAEKPNPKRIPGYPFRALFIVNRYQKYYDELTEKEHKKINHRLKAIKILTQKILGYLKNNQHQTKQAYQQL